MLTMSGWVKIEHGRPIYNAKVYERDARGRFVSTKNLKIEGDKYAKFKYQSIKLAIQDSQSLNQALGRIKSDFARTQSMDAKINGFRTFRDKMYDMLLNTGDKTNAKLFYMMDKMGPEGFDAFYREYQADVKAIYEDSDKNIARRGGISDLETHNQKIARQNEEAERMLDKMQDYLGLTEEDIKRELAKIQAQDSRLPGYSAKRSPYAHYYMYHAKLGGQI